MTCTLSNVPVSDCYLIMGGCGYTDNEFEYFTYSHGKLLHSMNNDGTIFGLELCMTLFGRY